MTRPVLSVLLASGLAAGGCGFDGRSTADGPAGDDAPPPIDAAVPIDAVDAQPDTDTDGDGVLDVSDNCPTVTNTSQDNEDADDRGDACDLCPHLAGSAASTDADADADGVGNQCDPGVGADRLVVFLGFNQATDFAMFETRSGAGNWAVSDGQLHQLATGPVNAQQVVWVGESISGRVIVDSRVRVDAVPAPGTAGTRMASVTGAYYDGTTVDSYGCGLRGDSAGAVATVTAWHYVNPPTVNVMMSGAFGGTLSAGANARVVLDAVDLGSSSTLNCMADSSPVSLAVPAYVPEGYPGFRTLGTVASFDYLFVVDVAP